MTIKWYKYTRGEVKFNSFAELKDQLAKDKTEIENYFAKLELEEK